ncbi:hypothetical protein MJ1HA_1361 [Metallosphaera sedula]|nr:hypothetical protein MJ1HA_1361 [Metallosphaera sedula]
MSVIWNRFFKDEYVYFEFNMMKEKENLRL